MLPRPISDAFTTPIYEFVIIATHNENQMALKQFERSNAEAQGIVHTTIETANGLDLRNSTVYGIDAILTTLKQTQHEKSNTLPQITILTDFNLGYSGVNISALDTLIEKINNLPPVTITNENGEKTEKKYQFVRTSAELAEVNKAYVIPVRLYTAGSGGQNIAPRAGFVNVDRISAKQRFGFDGKELIGFYYTLRVASAQTPSSQGRRLQSNTSPSVSPTGSPVFGTQVILNSLARARSVASTASTELSSAPSTPLRDTSGHAYSGAYSPIHEKPSLPDMALMSLVVPETSNSAAADMQALEHALSQAAISTSPSDSANTSPNTSPKRKSPPHRPSPIKTKDDAEQDASESTVAKKLFR
jgi:hypothetical protein